MARRHLRGVVRKVFTNTPEVDDSREMIGYRPAGILLAVSLLTLVVFFMKMGMTLKIAVMFLFFFFVSYMAMTRFVIEGGLVLCRPPVPALLLCVGVFGVKGLADQNTLLCLGALAACAAFCHDNRTGFMPAFANVSKLGEGEPLKRGALLVTSLYALVFGSVFCFLFYLIECYEIGASNAQGPALVRYGENYFHSIVRAINDVPEPDTTRLGWAGVGAVIMIVVTIGRYTFSWWPFHPIGMPIGVSWAAKSIILRLGGAPLYNKAKPFFIGLLVGHLVAVAIGFAVDVQRGAPGLNLYF
jgi:hypothetical protein